MPAPNPRRRQNVSDDSVRARVASPAPRGGQRRDPAVVSRRRTPQARAAGDQRTQPHAGQPPGRGDHAHDENADAGPADVLPIAPTIGMPDSAVDRTALYAGETVLRMTSVISARQAVTDLTPR